MSVACEDLRNAEVLHHHHAGKVDEGNVELVMVLESHLTSKLSLNGSLFICATPFRVDFGWFGFPRVRSAALGFVVEPLRGKTKSPVISSA